MAPFKPTLKKIPGLTDLKPLGARRKAEVYRAVRKSDGRAVAVKVLTGGRDALAAYQLQRFERRSVKRWARWGIRISCRRTPSARSTGGRTY
jgi:hypothetical protein